MSHQLRDGTYGKVVSKISELRADMEKDLGDFESMGKTQSQIEVLKEVIGDTSDGIERTWFSKRYENE